MNKITIVTAFININRDNWANFGRTEEQYFNYFKLWAKIKNELIVYVENKKLADKIMKYRESLGLKNKTKVIIIDDFTKIDIDLYNSIKETANNKYHKIFRTMPNNPEVWNYDYNYIMLMKMWCVSNAIERKLATGMVAWVDFGYLHGGDDISPKSDFNFEWKYDFDDKINIFSIQKLDDRPIFEIIETMNTYIMGTIIVGPDNLWSKFWNMMRNNMLALNKCGFVDDDQSIILMCYRENKDMFKINESSWGMPMKQFGGNEHLFLKNVTKKQKIIKCIKKPFRYLKKTYSNLKYVFKIFKEIQKLDIK